MASYLPSQVEETLAVCPRFRIVLVGNTGVGKSSLVESVFNIVFNVNLPVSKIPIDITDDRTGKADINHEYYSDQNPRFILHDSMGFEPGSTEKSEIVKSFLQKRSGSDVDISEQVHAIWLCIETPRTGSRLLQTGDEELLEVAEKLKIPVIVVFTKYDLLIVEQFRASSHISSKSDRKTEAKKLAEKALNDVSKELRVPFVAVSMKQEYKGTTLVKLTEVTRDHLRDVGGSLWAIWATAQQINARQKVELSISEGLKKYWRNLGENVVFQGHRLDACISRIHEDVLKVWNFNDPANLLSGKEFFEGMLKLVEPLRDVQAIPYQWANNTMDLAAKTVSVTGAISGGVVLPALVALVGTLAFQFLRNEYRKGASTATYLAAYIVDLILVLYEISAVLTVDPPTSLTADIVQSALDLYKTGSATKVHAQVKQVVFAVQLEDRIVKVIRDTLKM